MINYGKILRRQSGPASIESSIIKLMKLISQFCRKIKTTLLDFHTRIFSQIQLKLWNLFMTVAIYTEILSLNTSCLIRKANLLLQTLKEPGDMWILKVIRFRYPMPFTQEALLLATTKSEDYLSQGKMILSLLVIQLYF